MFGNAGVMADNEAYWIKRHEKLRGRLAAVGNIGSTEADNLQRYARTKRRMADLLRRLDSLDLKRKKILDAGCGIGLMSELFYSLGADVSGVDTSEVAIEQARLRCPGGTFKVNSLLDFNFDRRFDRIFAIDVLYHIVDDENWSRAAANLQAHLGDKGLLIMVDQVKDSAERPAEHVRFRTRSMYDAALPELSAVSMPDFPAMLVYRRG
jgi:2-polyprenyl-3-methyl-5-hydroxy-6-metoxy-1,4-benzoquinol methylase